MAANEAPDIPHINFLFMEHHYIDIFEEARKKHDLPESINPYISIHHYPLSQLPADVQHDTVVSPANSYGRLDGAFDDAISRAYAPKYDYHALTRVAQRKLYDQWRGFAPPGTCTLVRIPDEFMERSRNVWGCKRVALCPTMRYPTDVRWDREVVYECVWSLLCAISNHNRAVREGKAPEDDQEPIRSILMTPLGTGIGYIPPERWASQAVMAIKHFDDATKNPSQWSDLGWRTIRGYYDEVETTYKAKKPYSNDE